MVNKTLVLAGLLVLIGIGILVYYFQASSGEAQFLQAATPKWGEQKEMASGIIGEGIPSQEEDYITRKTATQMIPTNMPAGLG